MYALLESVAILLTGFMVGAEFAVAAIIHPTLSRLPDPIHAPAASALARALGLWMPIWYALGLVAILAALFLRHHRDTTWPILMIVAAVLWALAIIASVTLLVPINTRIAAFGNHVPPADWKQLRQKWDSLHRVRVVLLSVSFALLTYATLTPKS